MLFCCRCATRKEVHALMRPLHVPLDLLKLLNIAEVCVPCTVLCLIQRVIIFGLILQQHFHRRHTQIAVIHLRMEDMILPCKQPHANSLWQPHVHVPQVATGKAYRFLG